MNTLNTAQSPGVNETLDRLNAPGTIIQQSAAASLGSADFLRLMTAQLANQDPLEPQSNDQMLAQLAQFSSLESNIESNAQLEDIAAKLDALIVAQNTAAQAATEAAAAATAAAQAENNAAPNPPGGTQTIV
ncbi:flagellar hook capping FlgD N-terminal domain-containing protein [uncultured Erythrobacter sp.]|uniref:flagellar hook assembly protein FlgD n=1 Tax=uncultured Erythrobacter sp. TaxID=263913 RepID=UPI0026170266|nr:flagellar hook capping FlgD N-terminal domain-containing protein [uncultured Erythrobacter sp.]